MANVLYIPSSPRGDRSVSNQLGSTFLAAYRAANPTDTVDVLDLWAEDLPPFAGEAADGKLKAMSGMPLPAAEQAAFDRTLTYIERLRAADKVVVSVPMWNFSVPYRLKHWMDLVAQAGLTCGFDPNRGYFGLVTGRPLQLLLATGGDYAGPPMQSFDHLTPYLQAYFGFLGFTDIRTHVAGCTAYPPEVSGPVVEAALSEASRLAASF